MKKRNDKWYDGDKLKPYFHGKLRGYPGLAATASFVAEYIGQVEVYVEPFAGKARVAKYVQWLKFLVLNDKSAYSNDYCKKNFPDATVTHTDYIECIKEWDSPETQFLIDPPWAKSMYEKDFEDNTDLKGNKIVTFIDRTPAQYYKEICELVPTLKGNWIICSNHNRKSLIKWAEENNYYWKKIESTKTIMSHSIKVLCVSNQPFVKRGSYQATLL